MCPGTFKTSSTGLFTLDLGQWPHGIHPWCRDLAIHSSMFDGLLWNRKNLVPLSWRPNGLLGNAKGQTAAGCALSFFFFFFLNSWLEFPLWLSGLRIQPISMRMWVWSLVSLSVKDPALPQAEAQLSDAAGILRCSHSSDSTSSPGTSTCHRCGPKKTGKFCFFLIFLSFVFLGLHPWRMELPGLGVESEL